MHRPAMATNVTGVYLQVVEDVINNVRADFQSEGVDESVLNELQALWELKMMQSGAIQSTAESLFFRGNVSVVPVHDLNVPYEATEEYETPTTEMLSPPTPLINTVEPFMYQYLPPGPSECVSMPEFCISEDVKLGKPVGYLKRPAQWMNQKPLGVDVNIAYEEGRDEETDIGQPPITKNFFTLPTGKRKLEDFSSDFLSGSSIPQQDGAGDNVNNLVLAAQGRVVSISQDLGQLAAQEIALRKSDYCAQERHWRNSAMTNSVDPTQISMSYVIPQCDGNDDDNYDDDVAEEDYNEPQEEEPHFVYEAEAKTCKVEGAESDGSEPPLNEEDDDDLDDLDQGDEEPKTDHLVVAQFEKVTRSKNKWKCILKDGVMHLNQRDYLFSRANGEFEF
eukprot:c27911_g1_i1 orf=186-1361(+)